MDQTVWIHLLSNKQEKYCDQRACVHKLVLHRHTSLGHVSLLQHRSNWSMNEPCKAPDVHTAWNFAYPLSRWRATSFLGLWLCFSKAQCSED